MNGFPEKLLKESNYSESDKEENPSLFMLFPSLHLYIFVLDTVRSIEPEAGANPSLHHQS